MSSFYGIFDAASFLAYSRRAKFICENLQSYSSLRPRNARRGLWSPSRLRSWRASSILASQDDRCSSSSTICRGDAYGRAKNAPMRVADQNPAACKQTASGGIQKLSLLDLRYSPRAIVALIRKRRSTVCPYFDGLLLFAAAVGYVRFLASTQDAQCRAVDRRTFDRNGRQFQPLVRRVYPIVQFGPRQARLFDRIS